MDYRSKVIPTHELFSKVIKSSSQHCLLVVYLSETTLKGRNRKFFQRNMLRNILQHLAHFTELKLAHRGAIIFVSGVDNTRQAKDTLTELPGVANVSVATITTNDYHQLSTVVLEFAQKIFSEPNLATGSFRMKVNRAYKSYKLNSVELERNWGAMIKAKYPQLQVDLSHPQQMIMVEIHNNYALIYPHKHKGRGGMAVGSSGKVLGLLSGGIDSPVAAHMLNTRGCPIVYLHFHSYPFTGHESLEKIYDIITIASSWQPQTRLYLANLAEIQTQIKALCPEHLRTILYRRMMNRVANLVAKKEHALALFTGESVGQVASQTIENISVIEDAAQYITLRPLIGISKPQIIAEARRIGTYNISIRPHPDCCMLFNPQYPAIRALRQDIVNAEKELPIKQLVLDCYEKISVEDFKPPHQITRWQPQDANVADYK